MRGGDHETVSPRRRGFPLRRFAFLLLALAFPAAASAQPITGTSRLVDNFVEDAATVRAGWLEARGTYADYGGGRDVLTEGLVAFNVAGRAEVGARFGYLDRSRSENDVLFGERLGSDFSDNGFADVDIFGKLLFRAEGARNMAAGLRIKLPTASDNERLGSGSADYAGFFAYRRTFDRFAWVANGGIRANGDAQTPGGGSGNVSYFAGGGWIWKISYSWTFLADGRYETRRHDGGDVETSITPSLDIRPTENLALRFGVGFGLAEGSPDQSYFFSVVFHF